jgi:hypothetical protein
MNECCTMCKSHTETLLRGTLLNESPYLPFRLCPRCVDDRKAQAMGDQQVAWNRKLWENAALDSGEPPGSGLERRRNAPARSLFAAPNRPCTNCEKFIGDEPFLRGSLFLDFLPFILCKGCSDEWLAPEVRKEFWEKLQGKAWALQAASDGAVHSTTEQVA